MNDDIRVNGWNDLNDRLYQGAWNERLGRFRPTFAYRGMGLAQVGLQSGLCQRVGDGPEQEGHLLRNFRKYALFSTDAENSSWTWLALAQHHGLPTRLLDWTHSPYVALHFVTDDPAHFGQDGIVWCVDYTRTNRLLPTGLRALLHEEGSDLLTVDMLNRAAPTVADFDRLAAEDFVAFWEPPSLDERIVNQYALFSLMSSPSARLDHWLERHPDCFRRIVIPAALKWEVRDKLDQANITERVLFPGLDGLCRWLTRYYSPRDL